MKKANESPTVVVDADAIIAAAHPGDSNHKKASGIIEKLAKQKARVLYPVTAIAEAVTTLQRKLNSPAVAYATAVAFTHPEVEIIEVNHEIYSHAVNKHFSLRTSKKNTLFDCLVASVAEIYDANAIFSFDKFYKSQGFKLASEL